jgi:ribosomal protein S18 acetylase RimI-like enzyme
MCCEVQQIWVHDAHRRQGIGRRLMDVAESEAVQRGCTLIYLETFSFQAPKFYQCLGFEIVAEFGGFPESATKAIMRKLVGAAGRAT